MTAKPKSFYSSLHIYYGRGCPAPAQAVTKEEFLLMSLTQELE